jgi:hypothetical protein
MDLPRAIMIFIGQGGIIIIFAFLTYKILNRNRKILSILISAFLISIIIGSALNIIYSLIPGNSIKVTLHIFTNFFNFWGIGFLYMTNKILLESQTIYTPNRRLKYLLPFSLIYLVGMFLVAFLTNGVIFDSDGYPHWNLYFYIFMILVVYGFFIFPTVITAIKILTKFSKGELRRKYIRLFIGIIGFSPLPILIFTVNFLNLPEFRTIVSLLFLTILIWAYMFYSGLGRQLK